MKKICWMYFLFVCFVPVSFAVESESLGAAFRDIAKEEGVPQPLLIAIGLVESGRSHQEFFRPWPWTLNVNGQPYYFQSQYAAWNALESFVDQGFTNIDVGMMQLNWRYHRQEFQNNWDMLSPKKNLKVAASLLRKHWEGSRLWIDAAGRYHAPNNLDNRQRYQKKVIAALQGLDW